MKASENKPRTLTFDEFKERANREPVLEGT